MFGAHFRVQMACEMHETREQSDKDFGLPNSRYFQVWVFRGMDGDKPHLSGTAASTSTLVEGFKGVVGG